MRLSSRRGFTIAELLVAIVLLDVGVLSLVAATTVAARRQASARRASEIRRAAANRIEQLIAAPCVAVTGDSTLPPASVEHWWIRGDGAHREIGDSLEWSERGVNQPVVLRTWAPCPT